MTFFKLFAFAAKPLIQTTILRCLKGKQIIERSKHCLELFLTLRPPDLNGIEKQHFLL